jgi:hypothetical protein
VIAARSGDTPRIRRLVTAGSHVPTSQLGESIGSYSGARARTLYRGGDWAVATLSGLRSAEGMRGRGVYAAALHRVRGRWRVDLSQRIRIRILGPDPGTNAPKTPQIATELLSSDPLVESQLWLDGAALDVKGGGTPTRGTIYGAPATPLKPGRHVAVAYARTGRNATATAWTFHVL